MDPDVLDVTDVMLELLVEEDRLSQAAAKRAKRGSSGGRSGRMRRVQ